MAAGVACGLQNRYGACRASRVGSTPTRSRHFVSVLGLVGLLLSVAPALAQEPAAEDSTAQAPPAVVSEPVVVTDSAGAQAAAVDSAGPPVSAMGAFWRSLVLPGWGQAKVGQPGRGAFYFTMEAASLWMLFKTSQKKAAAERAGDEDLAAARKDQQEDWIVLAVFWALFSAVDAWVSAHMWEFVGGP